VIPKDDLDWWSRATGLHLKKLLTKINVFGILFYGKEHSSATLLPSLRAQILKYLISQN
jgi:hypothetical protein